MAKSTPLVVGHWITRIVTSGIFLMGAIPKLTGNAAELAEKLPGGTAATIAIAVAELAAIVLMFVPKTTLVGSGLAAVLMLGAIGSHIVGPVGMDGDMGMMLVLAAVAFVASLAATVIAFKRRATSGA